MKQGWILAERAGAGWRIGVFGPEGRTRAESRAADLRDLPRESAAALVICGSDEAAPRFLPCAPLPESVAGQPTDQGRLRHVLPSLAQAQPADLTQGEELLLAGALDIAPRFDGAVCIRRAGRALWAHVSAGEVISFQSHITGELRETLAPGAADPGLREDLFLGAVSEALSRPGHLSSRLASLPALRRLEGLDETAIRARVSGWLTGAELAAARPWWLGQPVLLITDAPDGAEAALKAQGSAPHRLDTDSAILAGLRRVAPLS